jgi:hypothetical protein
MLPSRQIQWPGDTDRFTIIGATGSGKTYAGLYNLSRRNYNVKPWIIYDFKGEELIASIEDAHHLSMSEKLPEQPGIFIVSPNPGDEELVDEHMTRIWAAENIGVYIDEGYMIGQHNMGFRRLLTQGRSKHIPMIINSQRPVFMDKFVFSESQYFQVFRLQHADDIRSAQKFIPFDISAPLPEFNSYYYDAKNNRCVVLRPGPDADAILNTFDARIPKLRKVI